MRSVIGMIVVFIGLYIVIYSDIFSLFAQKWFLVLAGSLVIISLLAAIVAFGTPSIRKRGGQNDKDIHLD